MKKRALITGITGQDGSYLAEHLVRIGYDVFGLVRRISSDTHWRLTSTDARAVTLLPGDITDPHSVKKVVEQAEPDEIYNLAAMSFVGHSWAQPWSTFDINTIGLLNILEAVRSHPTRDREIRIYQASSSEMFGAAPAPQNEETRFHPRSPYGVSKVAAHHLAVNYRESFGLFVSCGILFNHESPRRGIEFVTRKITDGVARIYTACHGKGYASLPEGVEPLRLGNLAARRDWGFAGDYVEAMHLMLQLERPCDYVIATGRTHRVLDVVSTAFGRVGMDWTKFTVWNQGDQVRPAEVDALLGDASLAKQAFGWQPRTTFDELIGMMLDADLRRYQKEGSPWLATRGA